MVTKVAIVAMIPSRRDKMSVWPTDFETLREKKGRVRHRVSCGPPCPAQILEFLDHNNGDVRSSAASALGQLGAHAAPVTESARGCSSYLS